MVPPEAKSLIESYQSLFYFTLGYNPLVSLKSVGSWFKTLADSDNLINSVRLLLFELRIVKLVNE